MCSIIIAHTNDSDSYDNIRIEIKKIYEDNHKCYGYRRVYFELCNEGILINHKTVQKLMNRLELKALRKKKSVRTLPIR
ncbi:IS3 family transposase [Segatella oris]|uniref:IS3 family transposase n=1 Tax=Segatella oris TaxID=28135 RepID=UPI0036D2AE9D